MDRERGGERETVQRYKDRSLFVQIYTCHLNLSPQGVGVLPTAAPGSTSKPPVCACVCVCVSMR